MKSCKNCKYLVQICKHPHNQGEFKGSVHDVVGYGCAARYNLDDTSNEVVFMSTTTSSCELFTNKY